MCESWLRLLTLIRIKEIFKSSKCLGVVCSKVCIDSIKGETSFFNLLGSSKVMLIIANYSHVVCIQVKTIRKLFVNMRWTHKANSLKKWVADNFTSLTCIGIKRLRSCAHILLTFCSQKSRRTVSLSLSRLYMICTHYFSAREQYQQQRKTRNRG